MRKNVSGMLGCWSDASAYDDFPKSADIVSQSVSE